MFILGTASMLALVPIDQIDLIGPGGAGAEHRVEAVWVGRVDRAGRDCGGDDSAGGAIERALHREHAPADGGGLGPLSAALVYQLHPRFRTPVNSIFLAGGLILLIGLGQPDRSGPSGVLSVDLERVDAFYAIPYCVMFLIPIFSKKLGPVSMWIRVAAVSGLIMTLLDIYFSAVPIIQVKSAMQFTLKVVGLIVGGNLLGVLLYMARTRGSNLQPVVVNVATSGR